MIEKGPFIYRLFLIIFWVGTCFGFVSEELFPPLASLRPYVLILVDLLIVIAGILSLKKKTHKWSIIIFFLIAIVSTLIVNKHSYIVFINGCRDFLGLLFILPILYYLFNFDDRLRFTENFDKQLKIFLWIQCFCTVWQFVKYGAGDEVGGSFGTGGFSGTLSMVVYMTSFYLINKNFDRDHYFISLKNNWIYLFLLFPTFLNETKASFIYLFAYLILLSKIELKTIFKLLALSPIIAVIFGGLFYVYTVITNQDFGELTGEEFYENYLVGEDPDELIEVCQLYYEGRFDNEDDNIWATDLPRFTKIILLGNVLEDSKGGILLGAGVGQLKGNTVLSKTRFAEKYQWYLVGTRPWILTSVVQLGFIGLIWSLFVIFNAISFRNRRENNSINIKLYLAMIALFMQVYIDIFQNPFFCIFFFYIALSTLDFNVNKKENQLQQVNV